MRSALVCCVLLAASTSLAQRESYWIANRASQDIMEVDACGEVIRAINMGTGLRSAHLAPDGKVWVVRFIQSTVDIVDPTSPAPTITNVTFSQGSAFQIAFDQGGNAWVSGGSGVEQFDPNGNSLQAIPLASPAPLGITVDADDNKWVAHRVSPGVVSRIDGTTGAVTTINVASLAMQPVQVLADFRGLFQSSHIWVLGDSSSDVEEYDAAGVFQRSFTLPSGAIGAVTMTADSGFNHNGCHLGRGLSVRRSAPHRRRCRHGHEHDPRSQRERPRHRLVRPALVDGADLVQPRRTAMRSAADRSGPTPA